MHHGTSRHTTTVVRHFKICEQRFVRLVTITARIKMDLLLCDVNGMMMLTALPAAGNTVTLALHLPLKIA